MLAKLLLEWEVAFDNGGEWLVLTAPQLEPDVGETAVRMGDGV